MLQEALQAQYTVMPTESATLPYDLYRARFVGLENREKNEDRIGYTQPLINLKFALLPRGRISLNSVPKLIVSGVFFSSFTIDPHGKLVSYE